MKLSRIAIIHKCKRLSIPTQAPFRLSQRRQDVYQPPCFTNAIIINNAEYTHIEFRSSTNINGFDTRRGSKNCLKWYLLAIAIISLRKPLQTVSVLAMHSRPFLALIRKEYPVSGGNTLAETRIGQGPNSTQALHGNRSAVHVGGSLQSGVLRTNKRSEDCRKLLSARVYWQVEV